MKHSGLLAALALLPCLVQACTTRIRDVRLVGGKSPREGRLEVLAGCDGKPATWYRTLCQMDVWIRDGEWPGVDPDLLPKVVCKQLGYRGGLQKWFRQEQSPPELELLAELRCNGSEAEVARCALLGARTAAAGACTTYEWEDMDSPYEVGVVCAGAVPRKRITGSRLVGGSNRREGRLEVRIGSRWGTVCNRNESDIAAAHAACRHLGFGGAAAARGAAFFGSGKLTPVLEIMRCTGDEGSLHDCTVSETVSPQDCPASAGFGVWCKGRPTITRARLVDGLTDRDGRLEVRLHNGAVGSACAYLPPDDARKGENWFQGRAQGVARSVCRHLGLTGGTAQGPIYGAGRNASLHNLACTGREASLSACSFTLPDSPCAYRPWPESRSPFFTVSCKGAKPQLRLADGRTKKEGRVEVKYKGQWRPICDRPFMYLRTMEVGKVVCRQLGLGGGAERHGSFYGRSKQGLLARASCTGSESSLLECTLEPPEDCDHHLGVACSGAEDIRAIRLVNGSSPRDGLLQVKLGNTWGWAVQGSESDPVVMSPLARVACRQLGYGGGGLRMGLEGTRSVPDLIGGLLCSGEEEALRHCAYESPEFGRAYGGGEIHGVACAGSTTITQVRLINGPTNKEGLLEVQFNNSWGGVASYHTEREVAEVTCRQLGLGGGAPRREFYTKGELLAFSIKDVVCTGREGDLDSCSFSMPDYIDPYTGIMGVACKGSSTLTGVRLLNGDAPAKRAGRLEVEVKGLGWGPVARDDVWSLGEAALVACRHLGFTRGTFPNYIPADYHDGSYFPTRYGASKRPALLSGLSCTGREASLEGCALKLRTYEIVDTGLVEVECS